MLGFCCGCGGRVVLAIVRNHVEGAGVNFNHYESCGFCHSHPCHCGRTLTAEGLATLRAGIQSAKDKQPVYLGSFAQFAETCEIPDCRICGGSK